MDTNTRVPFVTPRHTYTSPATIVENRNFLLHLGLCRRCCSCLDGGRTDNVPPKAPLRTLSRMSPTTLDFHCWCALWRPQSLVMRFGWCSKWCAEWHHIVAKACEFVGSSSWWSRIRYAGRLHQSQICQCQVCIARAYGHFPTTPCTTRTC